MAVATNLSGGFPMELIKRFVREEEGQGLVEYALIIGLIAIVAIAALGLAGTQVSALFGKITDSLQDITPAGS